MALIDLSQIVNLVYFASFFLIFFYGQRLQVQWQLVSVKRSLGKLERSKTAARQKFVDSISRFQMDKKTVETKIDRLNNSFTITPVSLDPSGIVGKLEHVLDTYDDHLKMEVKAIAPNATESDVNTLSNQLEISIGLDGMFRLVRHFYLLAKKTGGIMALAQFQMALPMIMEEAEAYGAAIDAFAKAQPIGDGVGPLVVSQIVAGRQGDELIKDTMVYDVDFEGRRVWVVRAKGPGGNVGKPGLAVEKLIQESGPISLVVTVDAALKFEGEPLFFFSSRRRHTISDRDWSSDVSLPILAEVGEEPSDPIRAGTQDRQPIGPSEAREVAEVDGVADQQRVQLALGRQSGGPVGAAQQIGRASCRERVEISVVGVSLKKKEDV